MLYFCVAASYFVFMEVTTNEENDGTYSCVRNYFIY